MASTTYDFRYTPTYTDCIQDYTHRPDVLGALHLALSHLAEQPFGNPKLQTHAVKKASDGTYTSYVGNHGHRLIWRLVGRVIVLLLFGEHNAVYRRAERIQLEIDDAQNLLRVIDQDPASEQPQPYAERRATEGSLFMGWNDRELAGFSLQPQEIAVLRRLNHEDDLVALEQRMRPEAWYTAMNLVVYGHPDGEEAAATWRSMREADEVTDEMPAPDHVRAEDAGLERALRDERARREFVPIAAEDLAEVLARPIEDWMIYLDPSQQSLVDGSFSGPARIRGPAGTGKTVVALHRARALARNGATVLFTTFVRNLPPVYQHLFERLAPECAGKVEFKTVHSWALSILRPSRGQLNLDTGAVARCWKRACDRVIKPTNPLARADLTGTYLKEEVDWLIKGRGLRSLDEYLALRRSGRGTPLPPSLRREVWKLYEAYSSELTAAGVHDFNDILIQALRIAEGDSFEPPFDAVIVDEAQDLTEVALRLLYLASGRDRRDGLLIVGDGQQSVYPGGFNLASLGINVRGRSAVLTRNYRNTAQVLDAAMSVVAGDEFDDGDEELERSFRTVDVLRHGAPPVYQAFTMVDDHDLGVCTALKAAVDAGTGIGDLAVLVPTNRLVDEYADRIADLGLPVQRLEDYDGTSIAKVKVGTFQRAKGLEFKQVFLPRLDPDGIGEKRRRGEDDETYADRMALLRRQLFVAMTRARDALWLGWVNEPASFVQP